MNDDPVTRAAQADDADLWTALEGGEPEYVQLPLFPVWPDEADDLETVVRRYGGRLPGSDPRL